MPGNDKTYLAAAAANTLIGWCAMLLGTWAVVRAWGLPCTGLYRTVLGSEWSQRQVEEFATPDEVCAEAEAQAEKRGKRGYVISG